MKFDITCDASIESGLNDLLNALYGANFDSYFAEKYYDDSGIDIFIVLMCRDSQWNFKQRIRFSKKENCLYTDIMLDLEQMKGADAVTRKRIIAEKLVNEVPQIVAKYKFKDFDLKRFSFDLRSWFEQQEWVEKQNDNGGL